MTKTRIWVDENYRRKLKQIAAKEGMSILEYTKMKDEVFANEKRKKKKFNFGI